MTTPVLARRGRVALTATATLAALSLVSPQARGSAPASVGASIDLQGGDATAKMVCGNVADAQAFADSRHVTIQRNACHPQATGGDIALQDVQIIIRANDVHASADNESLASLRGRGGRRHGGDDLRQRRGSSFPSVSTQPLLVARPRRQARAA